MLYYLFQYLDQTMHVSGTGVFNTSLLDQHLHLFFHCCCLLFMENELLVSAKSTGW
jgi:hypothetical protein